MQREAKKYLYDVQQAAALLAEFTAGKTFAEYAHDPMLRAAVERKFEVIGGALAQLTKVDSQLVAGIGEHDRLISFRNILIYGYVNVDDGLVWDVVETKLPTLRREVEALLGKD